MMRIALGSDHAGFGLKQQVMEYLSAESIEHKDFGAFDDKPSDYPDIAKLVAHAVSTGEFDRGIVLCGTGLGMAMAANKVPGIRAVNCWNEFIAEVSRTHNDANILALGARMLASEYAMLIVRRWLETPFSGEERHVRRVEKIG